MVAMRRVVFVHGAGRGGAAAWPAQHAFGSSAELVFVERLGWGPGEEVLPTDFDEDRRRTVAALGNGAHLVAHSYGAIAALMAAEAVSALVRSLVLFEPACMSLARGRPAVEAHIAAVRAALDDQEMSDDEFMRTFLTSLGAPVPVDPLTEAGRANARRLRRQAGPWRATLDPSVISAQPTLVVTAGESPLSEEIAEALERLGARRAVIGGAGHRPQDTREANDLLQQFWASIDA